MASTFVAVATGGRLGIWCYRPHWTLSGGTSSDAAFFADIPRASPEDPVTCVAAVAATNLSQVGQCNPGGNAQRGIVAVGCESGLCQGGGGACALVANLILAT